MANKYALLKLPGPKVIDQAVALANWQLFADSLVVGLPLLWSQEFRKLKVKNYVVEFGL